jgi:hypothetical protein
MVDLGNVSNGRFRKSVKWSIWEMCQMVDLGKVLTVDLGNVLMVD